MSKLTRIIEIADISGSDEIEVWTDTIRAKGTLFKDPRRVEKGIVTLKNAEVKPLLGEGTNSQLLYEWLNIFEDHITSFTIYKVEA